ncbi:MAG: MFS transporter [Alphaproteobacteria bacterium]
MLGLISFLTLVDLFAAQAMLPDLAQAFGVDAAAMGAAANASTFGMAVAGLAVAFLARRISRRHGIWIALALLAIPTTLLATTDDLTTFTLLRIAQGLCMSAAFTLTMAYLAEECTPRQAAGALAAYITGNVASNLFGRLMAANLVGFFDIATSFYVFAALNLCGAALAFWFIRPSMQRKTSGMAPEPVLRIWQTHFRTPGLPSGFAIGFFILFAFLGVFTYVNFVLVDRFALSAGALGLVYFVFLPSMVTTLLAGPIALRIGVRPAIGAGILAAALGLALTLAPSLAAVLVGLALVGAGTFFAQAATTGFISATAVADRASASGLYLTAYYLGGLIGSYILGIVFTRYGWPACVAGVGASLALILGLIIRLPRAAHP